MAHADQLIIRSRQVVTPEGIREAAVLIRKGIIQAILPAGEIPPTLPLLDAGNRVVMPGIVDTHVHVNEPGRTEWEGFETATRAAAAGGITTLVDMPLNSLPVTTTSSALHAKIQSAQNRAWIDCGFWGGMIPGNLDDLEPMVETGVRGFKAFLVHSGIPEFPHVTEENLRQAMPLLARLGVPLLAHAELEIPQAPSGEKANPRRYASYLATRPKLWENEAVKLLFRLCRETGCAVHIVHLSSADALPLLSQAREEGLPFTAETCPHYLFFAAEEIPDGRTEFKCAPPIRERENRDRLWAALKEGLIGCIVSDHSPCVPELKRPEVGDFLQAWGGIASLQWSLSAVWTEARKRGFSVLDLACWMCGRPAKLAGFEKQKGRIAPGYDADLVIWDPEACGAVKLSQILQRHPVTPYLGQTLCGEVKTTILRGKIIFDRGKFSEVPSGTLIQSHERLHRTR